MKTMLVCIVSPIPPQIPPQSTLFIGANWPHAFHRRCSTFPHSSGHNCSISFARERDDRQSRYRLFRNNMHRCFMPGGTSILCGIHVSLGAHNRISGYSKNSYVKRNIVRAYHATIQSQQLDENYSFWNQRKITLSGIKTMQASNSLFPLRHFELV